MRGGIHYVKEKNFYAACSSNDNNRHTMYAESRNICSFKGHVYN